MTEPALDIRGISKSYGDFKAVRSLSLSVPKGAVYGLLGPNGAGKTTSIRMILDIIAPDSGTISILGRPNTEQASLDRVGYLPRRARPVQEDAGASRAAVPWSAQGPQRPRGGPAH